MASSAPKSATWTLDLRERLDELLDGYRLELHDSLDDLTDEQTRLRLVPSKTPPCSACSSM